MFSYYFDLQVSYSFIYITATCSVQRGIAQNQDKGLSRDIPVILDELSLDLVCSKAEAPTLPWRFILCS